MPPASHRSPLPTVAEPASSALLTASEPSGDAAREGLALEAPGEAPRQGSTSTPPNYGRDLLVQLLVAGLAGVAVHGGRPVVSYRALELGASTFEIGLVQSAFSVVPALAAVAIGRYIDRVGERSWIAVAMAIYAVGTLIAAYAGSMLTLAFAQLVVGLGQIIYLVVSQSLIANYGPRDQREVRFGHYATANSVGQLIGPALAAFVIGGGLGLTTAAGSGTEGISGTGGGASAPAGLLPLLPASSAGLAFLALALVTSLGTIAAASLPRLRRTTPADGKGAASQPGMVSMAGLVLRRKGMPAAMTVSIVVASAVDIVIAYLPVYGEAVGLSVGLVGLLLSVRGVAGLVSRFFMGRLIAVLGRERTLTLSMVLAGGGLLLTPFVTTDWILIVLMIAAGLGLGLGQPMTVAWVAIRSARQERATALGVRIMGNRASLIFIPPLMGALAGTAGVAAIFVVLALALTGGAALAAVTPFDELAGNPDRPRPDAEPERAPG